MFLNSNKTCNEEILSCDCMLFAINQEKFYFFFSLVFQIFCSSKSGFHPYEQFFQQICLWGLNKICNKTTKQERFLHAFAIGVVIINNKFSLLFSQDTSHFLVFLLICTYSMHFDLMHHLCWLFIKCRQCILCCMMKKSTQKIHQHRHGWQRSMI